MRRRFSRLERWATWLAQDGKSALSGEPLGADFHADHRIPWSKGGATNIENCDAVTPRENLIKGAKMLTSRFAWQDEFIDGWQQHNTKNFFLCALPGAGKTHAALRVAKLWIEQGGIVVIVSPTRPLKRHWRDEFKKAKLYLDTNFYGYIRDNYCGIVTTYKAISSHSSAFQKLCVDRPVLLICDEIHHASEGMNSQWGSDLQEAFSQAKKRLLLSGTPVRSDQETTSFLEIERFITGDGIVEYRYLSHFEYDWPRALVDKVVRSLIFHRQLMETVDVEYQVKGTKTFSPDDELYLGHALDHIPYLRSILKAAQSKLDLLRKTDPSAGGIAVTKDIAHAHKVHEILKTLGEDPVVVTSENDDDSTDAIDEFRDNNNKKWIISVRQVSEGVNIPRLRVLAYLTNYTTELSFRQIVGRIVRRREDENDTEAQAHAFIPEVPKLVVHAEKIERMQALALKKQDSPGGNTGHGSSPGMIEKGYVVDGSESRFVGYTIHGSHFEGDRATCIRQLMAKYKLTEESASLMLDDPHFATGRGVGESPEDELINKDDPPWVRESMLRMECDSLVKDLVKIRKKNRGHPDEYDRVIWGNLTREIQYEFMEDGKPQGELTTNQLQKKKDNLRRAIFNENRVE